MTAPTMETATLPRNLLAEAAKLSRHTGCPDLCVVGAIVAFAYGGGPDGRLAVVLDDGRSRPHRHAYDLTESVSLRGLLAQRSARLTAAVEIDVLLTEEVEEVGVRFAEPVSVSPDASSDTDVGRRMRLDRLAVVLEEALGQPDRPAESVVLLNAREREVMLTEWNRTARPYPIDVTAAELVERQAVRTPYSVAVVDGSTTVAYAELNRDANRLAALLRRFDIGPGTRVGLHLGRGAVMMRAILAVWKTGAAYVPLDPAYPAERLRFMIDDADVALILTDREHSGGGLADGRRILAVDGDLAQWLAHEDPSDRPPWSTTDLAYVIYTSGSTGQPKGVEVEHGSLVNLLLGVADVIQLDESDGWLSVTSLSFDIAILELFGPLAVGGRVILAGPHEVRDGAALAGLLCDSGATILQATPTTWQMLTTAGGRIPPIVALSGGEPLPASLARELLGDVAELWNMYGPTEATVWATAARIRDGECARPPVGVPLPNLTAYIVDEHMRPVPVGASGELCLGGAGVARGYRQRPDLTRDRFVADPFAGTGRLYRTGDVARFRGDGVIELLGRRDQQVKVAGHRVELGEVEAALTALPEVAQAVVTVRDGDAGRELVATAVCRSADVTGADLREALRHTLPDYAIPVRVECRTELPQLPNGKVDRSAVAQADAAIGRLDAMADRSGAAVALSEQDSPAGPSPAIDLPPRELVSTMAALWAEFLDRPTVTPADDFFVLGGTSLRAGRLINKIMAITDGTEVLHVRGLFDAPTLAGFCAYLVAEYPSIAAALSGTEPAAAVETPPRRVDAQMYARFRSIVTGEPSRLAARRPRIGQTAFLLSAPRSGSTLLRVMLAGHPRLFVPPELELLGFDTMAERAAAFVGADSYAGEGLLRAVQELWGGTPADAAAWLARTGDGLSVADFSAVLRERLGDRLLVDKTSTYAMDHAALRRAEALFDEPKYIHLVRDPAASVDSYLRAHLDQVFRPGHDLHRRELAELVWLAANDNVTQLFADVPPARRICIRYEDLVTDPEAVMTLLTGFLEIDHDPAILEPYADTRQRMADGLYAESRMAGDPRFASFDAIRPELADAWRERFDPSTLSVLTTALAAQYGYRHSLTSGAVASGPQMATEPVPVIVAAAPAADAGLVQDTAPLTTHQRSIYLHEGISGSRTLYNICKAWRLQGEFSPLALRAALQHVVARHGALRTAITAVDGMPHQEVLGEVEVKLDIRTLPADADDEALAAVLEELAATALELESGHVLKALVVRLADDEHLLGLLVHHAVVDGSSLGMILSDLSAAYEAAVRGEELIKPPAPRFLDVARRTSETSDEDIAYWRAALSDLPPLLELPIDAPRPPVKRFRGGRVPISFDGPEWTAVASLARQLGVTTFTLLLTAFKALLHRYTYAEGIAVGTAFVNRGQNDDDVVGMFTGNLPLYTKITGRPTFRELAGLVRDTCLSAYEHHSVSFDDLVRVLNVQRDPSYSPIVQVLFTSEPPAAQDLRLNAVNVERLDVGWRTAKFDLTVSLIAGADALGGWWEFDADLFDEVHVRRMTGHYVRLLVGAATDPDRPIDDYDLLDADERAAVVLDWNATARPGPRESIVDAIRRHARTRPDAVAASGGGADLTYARLDAVSDAIAAELAAVGIGPDDIVPVVTERDPAFVAACLGVHKAGAAYVPIDPGTPDRRLAFLLEDTGARVAVASRGTAGRLPGGLRVITADLGTPGPARLFAPAAAPHGDHLAYVIYTSGSTGLPKGVLVERHSLDNFVDWFVEEYQLTPADRCTQTVNLGFDACVMELWPTLAAGASLHFAPAGTMSDPAAMWMWLRRIGATVSFVVTPLIEAMLAGGVPQGLSLRTVVTGGDRLHPQPQLRSAAFRLVNGYGPTENTILSTTYTVYAADPHSLPPIGLPVPNTTAYILDQHGRPVPVGVEGELYVGGAQVARGYLNRPQLTAERFLPDPFGAGVLYRTGDRVRRRSDGEIEFLGRADDQVKIRGYRIELGEIESVVRDVAGVKDAAVVVVGDGHARRLAAFYLAGDTVRDDSVADDVRQHLPAYMVPSSLVRLDALPATPNGKIDRRALAQLAVQAAVTSRVQPATRLEGVLLGLWRQVLQTDDIGVTDSFFEHGGHSLNAMRLASLIRTETGRPIGLPTLFANASVRALADVLGDATVPAETPSHLVRLRERGDGVPLVCVHASDGSVLPYAPLTDAPDVARPIWGVQSSPTPAGGFASVEAMAQTYLADLDRAGVTGPVHLLGWSFGGLVAFEMARRLSAAGRQLGRVVLLDSEPLTRTDEAADEQELLREFAWQLRRRAGGDGVNGAAAWVPDWPALVATARRHAWVDPQVDDVQLRQVFETFRTHVGLGRRYLPTPVDHPLHVYVATKRDARLRRAQVAAWTRLTTAGAVIRELPGDHFDAVSMAMLRAIVAELTDSERKEPR